MQKPLKFYQTLPAAALGTLLLLSIPLVAMQFTDEVDWSLADFLLMGALIFGAGSLFVLVMRMAGSVVYRFAMALAIGTTFFMIWANLAVGLIGAGPHIGNWMYAGIIVVMLIGIYLSRFQAAGLERTMYATAFSFILLIGIALLTDMQSYPSSSVIEIIGVNLFFALPYVVSGFMFRYVVLVEQDEKPNP